MDQQIKLDTSTVPEEFRAVADTLSAALAKAAVPAWQMALVIILPALGYFAGGALANLTLPQIAWSFGFFKVAAETVVRVLGALSGGILSVIVLRNIILSRVEHALHAVRAAAAGEAEKQWVDQQYTAFRRAVYHVCYEHVPTRFAGIGVVGGLLICTDPLFQATNWPAVVGAGAGVLGVLVYLQKGHERHCQYLKDSQAGNVIIPAALTRPFKHMQPIIAVLLISWLSDVILMYVLADQARAPEHTAQVVRILSDTATSPTEKGTMLAQWRSASDSYLFLTIGQGERAGSCTQTRPSVCVQLRNSINSETAIDMPKIVTVLNGMTDNQITALYNYWHLAR